MQALTELLDRFLDYWEDLQVRPDLDLNLSQPPTAWETTTDVGRDVGWAVLWAVVIFFVGFVPTVLSRHPAWLMLAGAAIGLIGLFYLTRGSARGRLLDAVEGYTFATVNAESQGRGEARLSDPRQLIQRLRQHQRFRLAAVAAVDVALAAAGFLVAAVAGAVY